MQGRFGRGVRVVGRGAARLAAVAAAAGVTLMLFMVLPFLQQVAKPPASDLELRDVGAVALPPPPPPPGPEEPEKEADDEPPPPELSETPAPPLDLSQIELALNPALGDGLGGDFEVKLFTIGGTRSDDDAVEAVFALADLDQSPQVVYQPPPDYPSELRRRRLDGTVHVLFVVDRTGRVTSPVVQKATHAAFERPALAAVKRWRFEPGKRNGEPVQFKMRVPITFVGG